MIDQLKPLLKKFIFFARDNLKFQRPPRLFLKQDSQNQSCMLGKTAHYDPHNRSVTLYISGRHPKDILRSFAHELVHHCQNERGDLAPEKMKSMNKNYAQENDHMRKMEKEAYLMGNMCFRDWEDGLDDKLQYKMKLAEQKFLKENKNMSVKISKKDLKELIKKLLEGRINKQAQELDEIGCVGKGKRKDKHDLKEEAEIFPKRKGGPNGCCGAPGCDPSKPHEGDDDLVAESEELEELGEDLNKLKGGLKDYMKNKAGKTSGDAPASVDADDKSSDSDSKKDEDTPAKEGEKPDIGDIDNDGNKEESAKGAAEDKERQEESKIRTPEQENALYESRFTQRNTRLFEKLLKEWTK